MIRPNTQLLINELRRWKTTPDDTPSAQRDWAKADWIEKLALREARKREIAENPQEHRMERAWNFLAEQLVGLLQWTAATLSLCSRGYVGLMPSQPYSRP